MRTLLLLVFVAAAAAFAPISSTPSSAAADRSMNSCTSIGMGLFGDIFGGGAASAPDTRIVAASHILLTGPNANEQCEELKVQIYKDALGWFGKAENGVEPEKLIKAVSTAVQYDMSACMTSK